jgi:CubicO group peptidase (beta-lactamase class C family)
MAIATSRIALALSLLASPTTALFAQAHARSIDSLMAGYAAPDGPGASVLVIKDGRTVFTKGYGRADIERGVAVTPATNFRLASLTKQFTATAVMLLVADHRLRYDDDITTLVAGLPAFARGVTVRHLLTHTGGLPDYEDFVPDSQTAQVHDADIPRLIGQAAGPKFAAGTRYAYSNTGYGLLALIIERAADMGYARFLHQRIFAPLHMTGTVAYEEGRSIVPHRAYGYTLDGAVPRRTDQSNTSAVLGDGGIYSSADDLAKWIVAQERHTLLSAAAQRLAWTPPSLPGGARTEYGFGWFVDHDRGALRLRHHGESRGFTNGIIHYPERQLAVVVLTNRTGSAPWDIAQRIAELYLGPSTVPPSPAWHPQ